MPTFHFKILALSLSDNLAINDDEIARNTFLYIERLSVLNHLCFEL